MSGSNDLRIAVLGVGMMGADHVARITERIKGATVAVVNDYFIEKAEQIAAGIPGCPRVSTPSSWPPQARPTRSSSSPASSTASR
jgi:myo-inositol 2-dehydrogenase/D-chiro-inositol 1-dehydrogenase